MKPHVQAYFKVPFNQKQVNDADHLVMRVTKRSGFVDLEKLPDNEFDAITQLLDPTEFIVEIIRHGITGQGNSQRVNMKIKGDETGNKVLPSIREWVLTQDTYNPNSVTLSEEEVLVVVKAEHCPTCSSGYAC